MSFHGRARALQTLDYHVSAGRSILLIGGRRAGKTTLLAHFAPTGARHVRADAGAWRMDSEQDALAGLAAALGGVEADRAAIQERLRAEGQVCLSIDESERLLNHPWTSDFLAWLRWLDGPNGLGGTVRFVLAGGPVLRGFEDPKEQGSPALNNAELVGLRSIDEAAVAGWLGAAGLHNFCAEVRVLAGGQPALLDRLIRKLVNGTEIDLAAEEVIDEHVHWFEVWRRQLGPQGTAFLLSIPKGGLAAAEFGRHGAQAKARDGRLRADWLGLSTEVGAGRAARVLPGPALFLDWLRACPPEVDWDLAISFATEDAELARAVKVGLDDKFRVFLAHDEAEQAWLWSQNLNSALPNVFGARARYVLVLSTPHYVRKHWTLVEFEAARAGSATLLLVDAGALPADVPDEFVCWRGSPAGLVALLDALRLVLEGTLPAGSARPR